MRQARMRVGTLVALLAAIGMLLAACGGGSGAGGSGAGGSGGGTLSAIDLKGRTFTVGSKEFTEQLILGQIAVQALKATGATVPPLKNVTGTTNVRTALTSGAIDMYWEYTGTGWSTHLKREIKDVPKDPAQLYAQVKQADAGNGVSWLGMSPLNNSYALAVSKAKSDELGLHTLSDFAKYQAAHPAQAHVCAAAEFITRDDGLAGLNKTYGITPPADYVSEMELSVVPAETAKAQRCLVGEVTTSDGSVAANNLVVLDDDKHTFPPYNVAMTVRTSVLQENPQLAQVFDPIAAKLDTEGVRKLNERVDNGGELPEDVAADWLKQNGFTG